MTQRALAVLFLVLAAACGSPPPSSTYRVVVFTDVHFTPFYDPALFPALQDSPASAWPAIFQRSTVTTLPTWGQETNYPLLAGALAALRAESAGAELVVFGGDIVTHDFPRLFYANAGVTDDAAMRRFLLKTVTFFADQVRAAVGTTPVVFTLGNNDAYEGNYQIQPGGAFLADTADLFYGELLVGAADRSTFTTSYRAGGYYVADPGPGRPLVVALNAIFFSPWSATGIDAAIQAELDWLESTLIAAGHSGRPVWLLLHIPAGGDLYSTASQADPRGHITDAVMSWKPEPQARFLSILSRHGVSVTTGFFGHTHVDEFRLAATTLEGVPAVSPIYGNNPTFKTFTFSDVGAPLDFTAITLDLAFRPTGFAPTYTFTSAYRASDPLGPALWTLFPALATNVALQDSYRWNYYAGRTPSPITGQTWPIYWCGIATLEKQPLIDCVNGYSGLR
ncbi:MAG: metallophosphoesterase [Deltaproteobacteria bacterium]